MKNLLTKLKNDKNLIRIIYIIGLLGIALIFISSFFGTEGDDAFHSGDISEYRSAEETRIEKMVESIEGVGDARVMITMENSAEQVYLDKSVVKEIEPTVRGVMIVCKGADSPSIKETVLESVTKALNISSDKVCIAKLKEE